MRNASRHTGSTTQPCEATTVDIAGGYGVRKLGTKSVIHKTYTLVNTDAMQRLPRSKSRKTVHYEWLLRTRVVGLGVSRHKSKPTGEPIVFDRLCRQVGPASLFGNTVRILCAGRHFQGGPLRRLYGQLVVR